MIRLQLLIRLFLYVHRSFTSAVHAAWIDLHLIEYHVPRRWDTSRIVSTLKLKWQKVVEKHQNKDVEKKKRCFWQQSNVIYYSHQTTTGVCVCVLTNIGNMNTNVWLIEKTFFSWQVRFKFILRWYEDNLCHDLYILVQFSFCHTVK